MAGLFSLTALGEVSLFFLIVLSEGDDALVSLADELLVVDRAVCAVGISFPVLEEHFDFLIQSFSLAAIG